jgi:hypothetical protein
MSHDDNCVGCEGEGRFGMAPVSARRSELRHRSGVAGYMNCKVNSTTDHASSAALGCSQKRVPTQSSPSRRPPGGWHGAPPEGGVYVQPLRFILGCTERYDDSFLLR